MPVELDLREQARIFERTFVSVIRVAQSIEDVLSRSKNPRETVLFAVGFAAGIGTALAVNSYRSEIGAGISRLLHRDQGPRYQYLLS